MKKFLLLLLFSISMTHPAFPAMKELEDLDKLIENKSQYDQFQLAHGNRKRIHFV